MKAWTILALLAGAAHADVKATVAAQVAAMARGTDGVAPFLATLAPDGVFMSTSPDAAVRVGAAHADDAVRDLLTPMSVKMSAKLDMLTTGGDATAAWVVAEITTKFSYPEFPEPVIEPLRLVELLRPDAQGAWQAVAVLASRPAASSKARDQPYPAIPDAGDPGPLTVLLVAPDRLDAAMAKDGWVLGTEVGERAVGAAKTHALLAGWRKLKLSIEGKPLEVHAKGYGFAIANLVLAGKRPDHFRALLVAVPKGEGWSVSVVDYAYGMNY